MGRAVAEDLLAAGREIVLDDKIGGDAVAAGGTLRLNGNISDNTYAAGVQVFGLVWSIRLAFAKPSGEFCIAQHLLDIYGVLQA